NVAAGKRAIALVGDGGFWHNGLASSVGNAVFNKSDNVLIVVDNGYAAATGGQDVPSSAADNNMRATQKPIEKARRRVGGNWVRTITRTYDVGKMRDALKEALTTAVKGPKVIIAQSECMLNKERRVRPLMRKRLERGERVVRERFGVDPDTCTGDHSCIRLSGCPSLTLAPNPDPLRREPVTKVIESCVGCGLCGEVAHAAVLCPSFYRAENIRNPNWWSRARQRAREDHRRLRDPPRRGARMSARQPRPITILIAALGGEGGGVLTDWIVSAAAQLNFPVQSTSIPGVAQRTGATTYYIEIVPVPAPELPARPVLALAPGVGDVDIVLASELMEAGRTIAGGFVTPDRTLMIASSARSYLVVEKVAMGDGRYDSARLVKTVETHAQSHLLLDMDALAKQSGAIINAVMLGLIAGCGRVPIPAAVFERAIRADGKAVD